MLLLRYLPFILGLQAIPVVPSVTVNSITAVEGNGPVGQGGHGVVKYSAAHIAPAESELVVHSSKSDVILAERGDNI